MPGLQGNRECVELVARSGLDWQAPAPFDASQTLAKALLTPTRIYVKALLPTLRSGAVLGGAHITGGGLVENPPRALPKHLKPVIDDQAWALPPVFAWMQNVGQIADHELRRTFNCGIGFVLYVPAAEADAVCAALTAAGEQARVIGHVAAA